MKHLYKYSVVIFLLIWYVGQTKTCHAQTKQHLFTDRDYCLSGDTVWFKVWIPEDLEEKSNVIHVQLASLKGAIISSVAVQSEQNWGRGFIHIPDSLSSGVYSVLPFLNSQRLNTSLQLEAKSLFVFNRFEDKLEQLEVPAESKRTNTSPTQNRIEISINRDVYSCREKVNGKLQIQADNVSHAVLTSKLVDPLSQAYGGYIKLQVNAENNFIPPFAEKNGVLVSGKILNENGDPQKNVLTVLSLSSEPPYFDYFLSDDAGGFHFFLKQAKGNANAVLQAIEESDITYVIKPQVNSLTTHLLPTQNKNLNPEQMDFVQDMVQANFIHKLFNSTKISAVKYFDMPKRFSVPFYGNPSKRVVPSEFIDLPNFQEISRELIMGVHYRTKKENISIRLINTDQSRFFDDEPLRLLNGIPVFKNKLFSNLKSTDISYIDIIEEERIFGDLRFNGVFAVSLHDKTNAWITQQPNILQAEIPCLQKSGVPGYLKATEKNESEPDFRQNYLWEELTGNEEIDFEFQLSDVKGKVEIIVEGYTKTNEYFRTSKLLEVK